MSNKLNYLDKKGLAKVFSLIKFGHKKIWHGTLAEWEALSTAEKAEYDQAEVIDEYTGVPVVVDKVESGNLNPVTSNAVAKALANIPTGESITPIDSIDLTSATCNPENVGKFYILKNTLTDVDISQDGDEWERITAGAILQLGYDDEGEYYYYGIRYAYETMLSYAKSYAVQKSSPVYNNSYIRDMTSAVNTAMQNNSSFTLPANCVLYISYKAESGSDTFVTVNGITVAEIESGNYVNGTLTLMGGPNSYTCAFNCVENSRLTCYKAMAVFKTTN